MTKEIPYNTYSHNFGLIIPSETGVTFTHQSGGVSCTQVDFEGVFLPLKNPTMRLDYPEWMSSRDKEKDISNIDLKKETPKRDFNSFPEWVQERGHFYNWDEFHYWLNKEEVDWYGRIDLIEQLSLWNYDPDGELHEMSRGYNPTDKWDSLEEIWSKINERLPFYYEEFNVWEHKRNIINNSSEDLEYNQVETPLPDGYPRQGASFKWIKILGSREGKEVEWVDELVGEYVIMTFRNSD